MDLYQRTFELCQQYNIKPARSKGQNFLINEEIYNQIIEEAELKKDDIVLEVGPGLGFLTAKLAQKAKQVVAVELDDKLANYLEAGFTAQGINNVKVINDDILKILNFKSQILNKFKIQNSKFKIVANLPYNITSIFLRKFLSDIENKPDMMVLMLQKEVAERIIAKPGKMSILSVSVQFYSQPEIISYVGKENFWPEPEVDSAIIKLKIENCKLKIFSGVDKERNFFRLVKFGFSAKRKMLKNNLAGGYKIKQEIAENKLKKAGFDPRIRAQELSVADWIKLFGEFSQNML